MRARTTDIPLIKAFHLTHIDALQGLKYVTEPKKNKKTKMSNLRDMLATVDDLSIFRAAGNGFLNLLVDCAIFVARFLLCGELPFS